MRGIEFITTLVLTVVGSTVFSADASEGSEIGNESQYEFLKYPALASLEIYRWGISPVNGQHCPMKPSCSRFASRAINRFGVLRGSLMAFDRLHRCGHDLKYYPTVAEHSRIRWEDPPSFYAPANVASPGLETGVKNEEPGESSFVDFLEEVSSKDILLLEHLRIIHGHLAGSRVDSEFEQHIETVGEILAFDPARSGASLKWYLQTKDWPLAERTHSRLRLYGAFGLLTSERWQEVSVVLGDEPYRSITNVDREAWRSARATTWLNLGNWKEAATEFQELSIPNREYLGFSDLALKGATLPRKSSRVAGLLGIVPGLGYAYTNHYKTSLAALVVIGLTTAATIKAHEQGNTGLSISIGLFAFGWYSGSIVGSMDSARRYNEYQRVKFLANFPDALQPGSPALGHTTPGAQ